METVVEEEGEQVVIWEVVWVVDLELAWVLTLVLEVNIEVGQEARVKYKLTLELHWIEKLYLNTFYRKLLFSFLYMMLL